MDFVVFIGIIGGVIVSLGNFYIVIVLVVGVMEWILEILDMDGELEVDVECRVLFLKFYGEVEYWNVYFLYLMRKDI